MFLLDAQLRVFTQNAPSLLPNEGALSASEIIGQLFRSHKNKSLPFLKHHLLNSRSTPSGFVLTSSNFTFILNRKETMTNEKC